MRRCRNGIKPCSCKSEVDLFVSVRVTIVTALQHLLLNGVIMVLLGCRR